MARQRRASTQGTILAILVIALGVLGPIIVMGAWAYFEYARRPGSQDEAAQAQNDELALGLVQIEELRAEYLAAGEEERIPLRSDGNFDGRSTAGRDLNRQIALFDDEYARISSILYEGAVLEARVKGARVAVATWTGTFALLYWRMPDLGLYQSTVASAVAMLVGYFTYRARLSEANSTSDCDS